MFSLYELEIIKLFVNETIESDGIDSDKLNEKAREILEKIDLIIGGKGE